MTNLVATVLAAPGRPGYGYGPDGGRHWGAMIIGALLLAGLVALVIWTVLRFTGPRHAAVTAAASAAPTDNAFEALRVRYARGEVDREAYLTTAADLGIDLRPAPPTAPPA